MKARPTAPELSPKIPPRLFLIVCYQQVSKDHFDRSLRRCGQLGSSFGCELLNGKQTICSQDGNDHLHCNDRHRGSYYWSQLHPAYRHHNEEKYTKYIELHKCTKSQYSQSAFQKLSQEVLAVHVPVLQLSDGLS